MVNFRRKLPDADWLEAIADLLINLAAGWFGAIFIVPNFSGLPYPLNVLVLTQDLIVGIVTLIAAIKLRRLARKKER